MRPISQTRPRTPFATWPPGRGAGAAVDGAEAVPRSGALHGGEHWRDAQRDARFAARLLARAPGFTLAAVLCLAIGTGLTAAMYAQVQSTILADLPGGVRDPDALIRVHRPVSQPEYEERGRHAHAVGHDASLLPDGLGKRIRFNHQRFGLTVGAAAWH